MTTEDAIRIAKIMARRDLTGTGEIVEMLVEFQEVKWVDFFNGIDDSISETRHDIILGMLSRDPRVVTQKT